jgi:hypothetical protein
VEAVWFQSFNNNLYYANWTLRVVVTSKIKLELANGTIISVSEQVVMNEHGSFSHNKGLCSDNSRGTHDFVLDNAHSMYLAGSPSQQ